MNTIYGEPFWAMVDQNLDSAPPLMRIGKLASSENADERKSAVQIIRESFHSIKNLRSLLGIVRTLAADTESEVRLELMGILNNVVNCCITCNPELIGQHVIPIIKRALTDTECLVQAESHEVLQNLLCKQAIKEEIIRTEFFPLLMDQIQESEQEGSKIVPILTIGKISGIVGRERIEEDFLNVWIELASHTYAIIRKACAAIVGDLGIILGKEATEASLLPTFIMLCHDECQEVRKNCAEQIAILAHIVSLNVRYIILAPLFVAFLEDESKWVQIAAYSVIGQFSYAFYFHSSDYVEHYLKQKLKHCSISPVEFERLTSSKAPKEETSSSSSNDSCRNSKNSNAENCTNNPDQRRRKPFFSRELRRICEDNLDLEWEQNRARHLHPSSSRGRQMSLHTLGDSFAEFNHFIYWQYPFPDIQIELDFLNSNSFKIIKRRSLQESGPSGNDSKVAGATISHSPEANISPDIKETGDFIHSQPLLKDDLPNSHKLSLLTNEPSGGDEASFPTSSLPPEPNIRFDGNPIKLKYRTATDCIKGLLKQNEEPSSDDPFELNLKAWRDEYELKVTLSRTISNYKSNALLQLTSLRAPECFLPPPFCFLQNQLTNTHADDPKITSTLLSSDQHSPKLRSSEKHAVLEDNSREMSFNINCEKHPGGDSCTLEEHLADKLWPEYSKFKIYAPRQVIQHFLNMMNPDVLQRVAEIPGANFTHMCAFALPAVALTLGTRNWSMLQGLFEKLVRSESSRETIAISLHDLAAVLGPQIAASDLIPVFLDFIESGEEVLRSALASNLKFLLKCLERKDQYNILQNLEILFSNEQMATSQWRFRHELVTQLIAFLRETGCEWKPFELYTYFLPLIHAAMGDRSHAIREISICLAHTIYHGLRSDPSLRHEFLHSLQNFLTLGADHKKYKLYIYLCREFLASESPLPAEDVDILVPPLLQLRTNNVPTVRLVLARCLNEISILGPLNEQIQETLVNLQMDEDDDVKYYATPADKR